MAEWFKEKDLIAGSCDHFRSLFNLHVNLWWGVSPSTLLTCCSASHWRESWYSQIKETWEWPSVKFFSWSAAGWSRPAINKEEFVKGKVAARRVNWRRIVVIRSSLWDVLRKYVPIQKWVIFPQLTDLWWRSIWCLVPKWLLFLI